jgi:hypothetical protein
MSESRSKVVLHTWERPKRGILTFLRRSASAAVRPSSLLLAIDVFSFPNSVLSIGQTVPALGNVPFWKYARTAKALHSLVAANDEC